MNLSRRAAIVGAGAAVATQALPVALDEVATQARLAWVRARLPIGYVAEGPASGLVSPGWIAVYHEAGKIGFAIRVNCGCDDGLLPWELRNDQTLTCALDRLRECVAAGYTKDNFDSRMALAKADLPNATASR